MNTNKINTLTSVNLDTVQLRYPTKKSVILRLNPLNYIRGSVKAQKKLDANRVSKQAEHPVNSALVKRYLAAIEG